jgi:phosphatidylserine/phosphatidylglycerophosphate/cardiolipin synthase-like enzyme
MQPTNHVITRIDQITRAIIYLINQSREELVLVSPYLQLQFNKSNSWKEFEDAMNNALHRGVKVTFISRSTDEYNRKDAMHTLSDWRKKGCSVYLLEHLHAKIYYSESIAIVSSMNLYLGSTIKNYECAVVIDQPVEMDAIRFYIEEMKDASLKYSVEGSRVINEHPAPSGTDDTWFRVDSVGSKYAHVKLEGKYFTMIDIDQVTGTVEKGRSYNCHATVKWRTVRGKKRVYVENVTGLVRR